MNRKNIIIIAVVLALLAIGYIAATNIFSGDGGGKDLLDVPAGEAAPIAPILSKGSNLDFEPLKEYNSQGQLFNYPKVNPDQISVPLPDLIK